jgi:dihydroorotate dehydrogenase electron transfer subunit
VKLHEVEVLVRERFGDHALLRYRWPGEAPEPGQFVMACALSSLTFDPFLARPLFVHDYDGEAVGLLFEVRGRGTALLAGKDAGLSVSTPLGCGFVLDGKEPVALVGGGVWVSPLKLLARALTASGIAHDMYLDVPATASAAYAAWLPRSYPHAVLIPTDGSPDAPKTVLNRLGDLSRYATIYASGPSEMLAAVKEASTIPAQLALREQMACANGSCYGCAVPVWRDGSREYARACVEGPVFGAEEVVELRR